MVNAYAIAVKILRKKFLENSANVITFPVIVTTNYSVLDLTTEPVFVANANVIPAGLDLLVTVAILMTLVLLQILLEMLFVQDMVNANVALVDVKTLKVDVTLENTVKSVQHVLADASS